MKDFDELLKDEVAGYEGRHDDLISQVPSIYRLLTHILDDPRLPGKMRPLVISAIAYFALSTDIMPEDLQGPHGYADDLFFAAFIVERIRNEVGTDEILTTNWDGKTPVVPLIKKILSEERSLIGDKRDLVFWYIGYEHLAELLDS